MAIEANVLQRLPGEVLVEVLSKLPSADLVRASAACKTFHDIARSPHLDERLWRDKLPDHCIASQLALPLLQGRTQLQRAEQGRSLLKNDYLLVQTHQQLACAVAALHAGADEPRAVPQSAEDAQAALQSVSTLWNEGKLLHADVELSRLCSAAPRLDFFVPHICLVLYEHASVERAACLLAAAAEHLEVSGELAATLTKEAPWQRLLAPGETGDNSTTQLRQLGMLALLLPHLCKLGTGALRTLVDTAHRRPLQLQDVPRAFREWLGPDADAHPDAPVATPSPATEQPQRSTSPASTSAPAATQGDGGEGAGADGAEGGEEAAAPETWEPCCAETGTFEFVGVTYSIEDFLAAMRALTRDGCGDALCRYARGAAAADLTLDPRKIAPFLRPAVAELVELLFVKPPDFQKELYAIHMWNVLAPPYICSRMNVWASTNYFLACIFLIKAKRASPHHLEFVDAQEPDGTPENTAVACLMEVSMLYFSYGWLAASRHAVLWAIAENEAGALPAAPAMRYELVGHLVDVDIGILQRSFVPGVRRVLCDALRWVLAMRGLALPPMFPLNAVFLQRVAKVLHCCMLRLPQQAQRETCGRAVLALYRLALSRFKGAFAQPVAAMPVPLVDCALMATASEGGGWQDLARTEHTRYTKHDTTGVRLLQQWATTGESAELDHYLFQQPDPSQGSAAGASVLTRLFKSLSASSQPDRAAAAAAPDVTWGLPRNEAMRHKLAPLLQRSVWLNDIQFLEDNVDDARTWHHFENDLAMVMGIPGGGAEARKLMRTVDQAANAEAEEHMWEDLIHIYEPLAQTCAAVGLHALAAVYYGACADAIARLPPRYVIDESSPANDAAPQLTAGRFLAMTVNQQATELISAGDYAAALQAAAFGRRVAEGELAAMARRRVPPGGAAKLARDRDDLWGLLSYNLSQTSCCVLELVNRHGLRSVGARTVTWEPATRSARGEKNILKRGADAALPLGPEVVRDFAAQALEAARGRHVDSYLQAAFTLGDIALSRYDLAEAMRVFSLVALVATHGQVQHFSLMLQSHSFRAICALNAGDSAAARALILRCVAVHGFRSADLAGADPAVTRRLAALAESLREAVAAAPRYDGERRRLPPCGERGYRIDEPATARRDSWHPAEGVAAADDVSGDRGSSSGSSHYQDAAGDAPSLNGEASDASTAFHDASSRGASTSGHARASPDSGGRPPSRAKTRKAHGVELQYDSSETPEDFEGFHEAELVTRLQAHLVARGHSIPDVMETLRMRMMEIHMADCPPGEEQARMAALLDLPPNEEPPAFRAAVLHACREARRLPTLASTVAWRTSYLIRHGAPPNEVLQEHFQGGMLLAALHGQGGDGDGEGGGQPQAQAYLEQFQQLQAMVLEAADAQEEHEANPSEVSEASVSSGWREEGADSDDGSDAESAGGNAAADHAGASSHPASAVWAMLQAAETPGEVPAEAFRGKRSAIATPQPRPQNAGGRGIASLSRAADASLEAAQVLLQAEHLNCEEAEMEIIHGFMQQLSQQILITHGDLAGAARLLAALAGRRHDVQGHVHVWYWAGAIAQHRRDFTHALLFFRAAVAATEVRPHMSMSAKALVAGCESILSDATLRCVPELTHARFVAGGSGAHHVCLCTQLLPHLEASGSADVAHDRLWPGRSRLITVRGMLAAALDRAEASADEGVELRALMSVVFVLKCEGRVRAEGEGYSWGEGASVPWLRGSPKVGAVFGRWQALMGLRRNVMSLWRMLGVAVVLDPDSVWGLGSDAPVQAGDS